MIHKKLGILFVFLILFLGSNCASYLEKREFPSKQSTHTEQEPSDEKNLDGLENKKVVEDKIEKRLFSYKVMIRLSLPEKSNENFKEKLLQYINSKKGYILFENLSKVQFKIPADLLRETIKFISQQGKVIEEEIVSEDLTLVTTETKIKLENSIQAQTRLREILKKASNVKEVLEVEKELTRVTEEIETLKSRMKLNINKIDYSEFTVNFFVEYKAVEEFPKLGPIGWLFYLPYRAIRFLIFWE
ncbi:MAG: DUF4349 domain-containing protein [Leptospiraceae bacterium]|nr:DUF4349 domain-containing protein [Leptospiraceae bacterium]